MSTCRMMWRYRHAMHAMYIACASPVESSKFRGCVLTALCKHRGRMNVQWRLTKILLTRGCLGCSYIDMLRILILITG